jgi:ribosomal protein S18 acetylase RimI-like enzyme
MQLEAASFEPERCDSRKVFTHSLASPGQEVWIAAEDNTLLGSLFLRFHPRTCRVHSIAVASAARGRGLGRQLMDLAHRRARARGCTRMSLEADARNATLLAWYEALGYRRIKRLRGYYAPKWDGFRLQKNL